MRQWLVVSTNTALNTHQTFINHANYKIIDANVMDWANVTNIHTPTSAKRYSPPPRTSTRCTMKILPTRLHSLPRGCAPFGADQRERGLCGRECLEWRATKSYCRHHIARWKFLMNTKYKCFRCELPTCNNSLVFEENEDFEG